MAKGEPSEIERIIARIRFGQPDDQVILFVPSHDKANPPKPIKDQDVWASNALDLFGELYGGATALQAVQGVWKEEKGGKSRLLHDRPIMIQTLAQRADVQNVEKLAALLEYAKRMGKETDQACVAISINDVMHYIFDFKVR